MSEHKSKESQYQESKKKNDKALFIENQGLFIPCETPDPIRDAQNHDLSKGRVGGKPRIHPPINVNEIW